jgi:lysophospholipase L1-like esterase
MLATTTITDELTDQTTDLRTDVADVRPWTGAAVLPPGDRTGTVRRRLRETARERLDPDCLPPSVLADMLASSPWRRFAVLGDSIAAGVGDPVDGYRDVSWADRLDDALRGRDVTSDTGGAPRRTTAHLNLGVRGLRAGEIRATQLDEVLAFGPDLVVATAGANDMLARRFDPERVEDELHAIVGPLAASGALVVTFGLLDLSRVAGVPDGARAGLRQGLEAINAVTTRVTARHRGLFVDFFEDPAVGDHMMSADQLHANRRGHAHIAAVTARALVARWRHGG